MSVALLKKHLADQKIGECAETEPPDCGDSIMERHRLTMVNEEEKVAHLPEGQLKTLSKPKE